MFSALSDRFAAAFGARTADICIPRNYNYCNGVSLYSCRLSTNCQTYCTIVGTC